MRILFISILFIALTNALSAQHCTFTGKMQIKDGETLPYRLSLDVAGVNIKGVSITTQDGKELKARIKGVINKDKNIMVLAETGPVGKLSDSIEMCYFNSILKWKLKKGRYVLSGAFVGKDRKNNPCSQGSVSLEAPESECAALLSAPQMPVQKDSADATIVNAAEVTAGHDKRIDWQTGSCILELWDGGLEDGDVVSVLVNGKPLLTDHVLTAERKKFNLTVSEKLTIITIVAGEEGANPPNTAELQLTDGEQVHRLTAFNKKGKSASIILVK